MLPELACYIFKYLRSKQRAKLMTVNKHFSKYLLETSKALSSYPSAYTAEQIVEKDKVYSSRDYHLIVRLKYDVNSHDDLFHVGMSCDLDVVRLFMKRQMIRHIYAFDTPYICEIILNAADQEYNSNTVMMTKWIITKYKTCYNVAMRISIEYDDVDLFDMCIKYSFAIVKPESICRYDAINIVKRNISILNRKEILKFAAYYNSLKVMKFMTTVVESVGELYTPFSIVCANGNMEMVKLLINGGIVLYNLGMITACRYNRIDVIKLMIELGANDWNSGLQSAQISGCFAAANLMIAHGATAGGHIEQQIN